MHTIEQALVIYKSALRKYRELVVQLKKKYGVDFCPLQLSYADLDVYTKTFTKLKAMQTALGISEDEAEEFEAEVRAALNASAEKT